MNLIHAKYLKEYLTHNKPSINVTKKNQKSYHPEITTIMILVNVLSRKYINLLIQLYIKFYIMF